MFEHGDKPGKYLFYLTKTRIVNQTIASISDGSGSSSTDPEVINSKFLEYYKNVFKSEQCENSESLMEKFFSQIKLPTLPEDKKKGLNAEISESEVEKPLSPFRMEGHQTDFHLNFIKNLWIYYQNPTWTC